MIDWLIDTLIATGALMALVLLVRRPIGRLFGPGAAYALWLLPMIRLVLPPLALPIGLIDVVRRTTMNLEPVAASASPIAANSAVYQGAPTDTTIDAVTTITATTAQDAGSSLLALLFSSEGVLTIWIAGAAAFLVWRTVTYRAMRTELLRDARMVARSSTVKIVEGPAINAPLAFGVFDRIVALPRGFLAGSDSEVSDFAIAHELEHHAGRDLLALIVMQPLFALHWFNPLGWVAWRAVRADQESFCDARLMRGRSRAERARYAQLIASMAGGRPVGLAAAMAGPLSGDKPIVQRIRALAANDVTPARRAIARSLFAVAIAAVPATATVSYAAMDNAGQDRDAPLPPMRHLKEAAGDANLPELPGVPAVPSVPTSRHLVSPSTNVAEAPDVPEVPAPPEAVQPISMIVPPQPPVPPTPPTQSSLDGGFASALQRQLSETRAAASEAGRQAMRVQRSAIISSRQARRVAASAPRVIDSLSADGMRRTITIARSDGTRAHTMILDAGCPADSVHSASTQSARVVCTGESRSAKLAALNALQAARASLVGQRELEAHAQGQALADIDEDIAKLKN